MSSIAKKITPSEIEKKKKGSGRRTPHNKQQTKEERNKLPSHLRAPICIKCELVVLFTWKGICEYCDIRLDDSERKVYQ